MPDIAEYFGLARSWIIYNGRPLRIRQLAIFYRQFLGAGDLYFDIGAHVGTHVNAVRRLAAHVVALEPQPLFFQYLRNKFHPDPGVELINKAAGPDIGPQSMQISRRTPTVSTLSTDWMERVKRTPSFQAVDWDYTIAVEQVTLDGLIEEFGVPRFCKIDVEGYELEVLMGLSHPIPYISFEHTSSMLDRLTASLDQLNRLGEYQFNWTVAERMRLEKSGWLERDMLINNLQSHPADGPSIDIIARNIKL